MRDRTVFVVRDRFVFVCHHDTVCAACTINEGRNSTGVEFRLVGMTERRAKLRKGPPSVSGRIRMAETERFIENTVARSDTNHFLKTSNLYLEIYSFGMYLQIKTRVNQTSVTQRSENKGENRTVAGA